MNIEMEIDIFKLLMALKKKFMWIIASALAGVIIMSVYTYFFAVPKYTSSASVYISNKIQYNTSTSSVNLSDFNSSVQLVPIYSSFVKTATAFNRVIEDKNITGYTAKDLKKMVSTKAVEDTAILLISVSAPNPDDSAMLTNALATLGVSEMSRFAPGSTAYIIEEAEAPKAPYSPSVKKNIILGFLIGVVFSSGIIILLDLLDTRIKEEEDLSAIIDAPVLGNIGINQ